MLQEARRNFQETESEASELLAIWIIFIFCAIGMIVTLYYALKWLKGELNENVTNDCHQVIPID